ncbi:hypothetical protein EDB89DRAFT_1909093 [Lactarius sanguifluus]|nr:hypothetical protein EDB89DRAFT_1909093 [Lactarius sanguifluus]
MMKLYSGTRQPVASSSTAPANPIKDEFPEALTYRFNDNSAWVPAAKTHDVVDEPLGVAQEAVDLAKHAYPELRSVRRDRITFHTTGKSSIACITPAAWQLVVRRLPPYHVVDVRIRDTEGLDDDFDLPEYPYSATNSVMREKEERYLQKEESRSTNGPQVEGNRLSKMISFIRGTDS